MSLYSAVSKIILFCVFSGVTARYSYPSEPSPFDPNLPIQFTAAHITYDAERNILSAQGNIELMQGECNVRADAMHFHHQSQTLFLHGNVILQEPSIGTIHAPSVVVRLQNYSIEAKDLSGKLPQNGILWAQSMHHTENHKTSFQQAGYTACISCSPQDAPAWALQAGHLIHDEQAKVVHCKDITLRIHDVPVLRLPALSIPTARKSGVLSPLLRFTNTTGIVLGIPFYQTIGKHADIMLTPMVGTKGHCIGLGTFRQTFKESTWYVKGSIEHDPTYSAQSMHSHVRGYIDTKGVFSLHPTMRLRFQGTRLSDRQYFLDRPFLATTYDPILPSFLEGEYFNTPQYGRIRTISYQGLHPHAINTPLVLPDAQYVAYLPFLGISNAWWEGEGNISAIYKAQGSISHHLVTHQTLQKLWRSKLGTEMQSGVFLRLAAYTVAQKQTSLNPKPSPAQGTVKIQLLPQAFTTLSWPWLIQPCSFVVMPKIQLIVSPQRRKAWHATLEDVSAFSLSDKNLFSLQRFPGIDRADTGSRLTYGVSFFKHTGCHKVSCFLGQSYAFTVPEMDLQAFGINQGVSDLVGKLQYQWGNSVVLEETMRIRPGKGIMLHEGSMQIESQKWKGCLGHIYEDKYNGSMGQEPHAIQTSSVLNTTKIHQLTLEGRLRLRAWELRVGTSYDLGKLNINKNGTHAYAKGNILTFACKAVYHHQCFSTMLGFTKDFLRQEAEQPSHTENLEEKPRFGIVCALELKTLGGFNTAMLHKENFPDQ